jgi:3-hydroxyacyl-CoA dehydrogenase/enoyl-CoA hydratase/3-hydroxybutyryl-CoA epimerase
MHSWPRSSAGARSGVAVTSAKNGFIAGADIREFERVRTPEEALPLIRTAHAVVARLERLPCPTVAVINGYCLGGGLELALACRYRVLVDDPKATLALPEVMLGIHPGFGGTVRAVRLLGRHGRDGPDADRSHRASREGTRARARRPRGARGWPARSRERTAAIAPAAAPRPVQGTPALVRATAWHRRPTHRSTGRAACKTRALSRALRDRRISGGATVRARVPATRRKRSRSRDSCARRPRGTWCGTFFLQERLKALGGRESPATGHVHVVGAGVMGGDIAAWCAQRGFSVTLQDRSEDLVSRRSSVRQGMFAKRLRTPQQIAAATARLTADVPGAGIERADVVIEAIFENEQAKRELYARVEPRMKGRRAAGNEHVQHHARVAEQRAARAGSARRPAFLQPRSHRCRSSK